jgi:hypothetical protein
MKKIKVFRLSRLRGFFIAVSGAVVLAWLLTWGVSLALAGDAKVAGPEAAPQLQIVGPETGKVNVSYTFTGGFDITVQTPITYAWRATAQEVITHTGSGVRDVVTYTWSDPGDKVVVLTAQNITLTKTTTHHIVIAPHFLYLPGIVRNWPPRPYKPTLNPIDNGEGEGSYTVSWTESPTRLSDIYYLWETSDSACTAVLQEYTTDQQQVNVVGKQSGVYYYCVRGYNELGGYGAWSNIESVEVGSAIYIDDIQFKPPPGGLVKEEYVLIKNRGDRSQVMTGWRLEGEFYNTTFNFPSGFVLPAHGEVRVWSLNEEDTATDLYWGTWGQNWFDNGDTARLYDASGQLIDTYTY